MTHQTIDHNNCVFSVARVDGKIVRKLIGMKCPHCGYFAEADDEYEEWSIDAYEHITYCNPAHRRAEMGERL